MAEYIDREQVCENCNNKNYCEKEKCPVYKVSTADVVPKSEVDNLKVLLEMKEKAYEGLKELYDTDTEALVKAREKTEVEVAREIFEEIDRMCIDTFGNFNHRVFAELKKKYIGESDVKRDTV